MKAIRILITGLITASLQFTDAAPTLAGPAETFLQIRRLPPPPDPLHLFSRRPRRHRVVRHNGRRRGISFPHIKLPPPPPHP